MRMKKMAKNFHCFIEDIFMRYIKPSSKISWSRKLSYKFATHASSSLPRVVANLPVSLFPLSLILLRRQINTNRK